METWIGRLAAITFGFGRNGVMPTQGTLGSAGLVRTRTEAS